MLMARRYIIIFIKRNIKKGGFRHVIELLMDFYKNKSSREVLEVLGLGERFIFITEIIFLNVVPSTVNFIIITAYMLHVINKYIRLIVIAIVVVYI